VPLAARALRLRTLVAIASLLLVAAPACAPAGEGKSATSAASTQSAGSNAAATKAKSSEKSAAKVIAGRATVVDGDGVEIGGVKIRLFGVDAPEIDQYCNRADGTRWRCGQYATVELDRTIAGREVTCAVRDKDRYGRPVAVCRVAEIDLAATQAKSGLAVAYRKFTRDYVDEEDDARSAKRGVWSGRFEMPWDWRNRAANARQE
jgi:endonuclease YncB( thermonuclease family)